MILVVDDDEEVLERTGEILDFEDYRVVSAKDGPEALRIYRNMRARRRTTCSAGSQGHHRDLAFLTRLQHFKPLSGILDVGDFHFANE